MMLNLLKRVMIYCLFASTSVGIDALEFETNRPKLEKFTWGLYSTCTKVYYALLNGATATDEQYLQNGFKQGVLDEELNSNFLDSLEYAQTMPFMKEDCDPNYIASSLDSDSVELLNKHNTYIVLGDMQLRALEPILLSLKQVITECIGSAWHVGTIRAWRTPPSLEKSNPLSMMHVDGYPLSALKIMIYPRGASYEKGSIELQLPDGNYLVRGGPGTWIFFKNSEIYHHAVVPQVTERIAIEIVIVPSFDYDLTPIVAGQNARNPIYPWQKPASVKAYPSSLKTGL